MSTYGGYEDNPLLAELYDHNPSYSGRPDVEFWVSLSRSARGATLELGCGTGRVLIPTAAAGYPIVGLDLSEPMLARCRQKLQAQPAEVQARTRLVRANMAGFDIGETFGLITTPFRPFQHLVSVEDQLGCLQSAHRHLRPGGLLVLDLFRPNLHYLTAADAPQEREDFNGARLPDGSTVRRTHRLAAVRLADQVNDSELIYYIHRPDGRCERVVQAFPFRWFLRFEVEHLLARCGFRVRDIYGSYDRSPFGESSPEMIFVAEKV